MSSRPKGWPRHAYQKRAGAIFFGFVAMFAAWFIETRFGLCSLRIPLADRSSCGEHEGPPAAVR